MQIAVTAQRLQELGACKTAIDAFRELFGDTVTVEWTREKQEEISKGPLGKHLGWAATKGLLPLWSANGLRRIAAARTAEVRAVVAYNDIGEVLDFKILDNAKETT